MWKPRFVSCVGRIRVDASRRALAMDWTMIAIPVTTVACALVVCVVAASPLKAESARFTGMASVYAYTGEKPRVGNGRIRTD